MNCIQQEEYDPEGNLLITVRMQQVDWARLENESKQIYVTYSYLKDC